MSRVHVVLPGDVDDPRSPSGGNTYGRRVARELDALGWTVARHRVAGSWPRPSATEEAGLARLLAAVPDGETVLLDGLVACGVPDAVVPQAGRVRLVVLVHLPLAAEVGLPADVAADLDARERATLRAADAIVVTSAATARRLALPTGRDAGPGAGPGASSAARPGAGRDAGPGAGPGAGSAAGLGPRRGADLGGGPDADLGAVDPALPPVFVAEPGTDPAPVSVGSDGASALVCVAAVTPVKGHDVLVDALAEVADRPWTCVCAGPLDRTPDHVAEVRRRIDRAGLTDRVRLVGPLDPTALDAAYATADLAVLASRTETYGMAAAEALARGLPLVATTGGGLPDTVGHAPDGTRPGLLVPPDDPAALAAALRRWFDEPALRAQLRTAATARAASLPSWSATAEAVAAALVPDVPAPRRAPDRSAASAPATRSALGAPNAPAAPSPHDAPGTGRAPTDRHAASPPSASASPAPGAPSAPAAPDAPSRGPGADSTPGVHHPPERAAGADDAPGAGHGEVPQPRSSREAVRPSRVRGAAK
jgi:glycosyltransferase involved in cell wall biosynthesis